MRFCGRTTGALNKLIGLVVCGLATAWSGAGAGAGSGSGSGAAQHYERWGRVEAVRTSRFDETTEDVEVGAQYSEAFGVSGRIGPAVVAGWERRRQDQGRDAVVDRLAQHYIGPALRLRHGWFTAQAEVRFVHYVAEQPVGADHRPAVDGRLRLNRWRQTVMPLQSWPLLLLNDSYLDGEWRPTLGNDLVFTAFDRLGLRRPLSEALLFDVYAEPCVMLDARQSYEHNRLEWRNTLRLRWLAEVEALPIDLTVAYVHHYDLPRAEGPAPGHRRSEFGWRFALMIAGDF